MYLSDMGAPGAGGDLEEIFALGIEKVVMFGSCGVLEESIRDGAIMIPNAAVRDEGLSYHYAPPSDDVKFDRHGIRYGWAGNQAVLYASSDEIKSIESFRAFHEELETLPVPRIVKDSIKPKTVFKSETESVNKTQIEDQPSEQEKKGFFAKGKTIAKRVGHTIGGVVTDASERAIVFSEENFRNKKEMERQMLFFGVISLYNEGLETFMKS